MRTVVRIQSQKPILSQEKPWVENHYTSLSRSIYYSPNVWVVLISQDSGSQVVQSVLRSIQCMPLKFYSSVWESLSCSRIAQSDLYFYKRRPPNLKTSANIIFYKIIMCGWVCQDLASPTGEKRSRLLVWLTVWKTLACTPPLTHTSKTYLQSH